jgi:hypothetical protein
LNKTLQIAMKDGILKACEMVTMNMAQEGCTRSAKTANFAEEIDCADHQHRRPHQKVRQELTANLRELLHNSTERRHVRDLLGHWLVDQHPQSLRFMSMPEGPGRRRWMMTRNVVNLVEVGRGYATILR